MHESELDEAARADLAAIREDGPITEALRQGFISANSPLELSESFGKLLYTLQVVEASHNRRLTDLELRLAALESRP